VDGGWMPMTLALLSLSVTHTMKTENEKTNMLACMHDVVGWWHGTRAFAWSVVVFYFPFSVSFFYYIAIGDGEIPRNNIRFDVGTYFLSCVLCIGIMNVCGWLVVVWRIIN
jgi:hypothetical protein